MGPDRPGSHDRRIRVFVSSTFKDMAEERDALMTHAWPELRRFCRERQVELTEVDLRWGVSEEQSARKETLKLCLDEIRACRPFFVGLLGERYGWVPGDDAFTPDLKEEQPWLGDLRGTSVTELEIMHGVLNAPEMAGRARFYLRDPAYAAARGAEFLSDDEASSARQDALKARLRATCAVRGIPLRDYPDPSRLAALVLKDLKAAIGSQFPIESVPDPLTRDAHDHEAFAETRRRTYVPRPDDFAVLDRHATGAGGPLAVLGASGSGKSALLANWGAQWRERHPRDFVFQHYVGGTPDSATHGRLAARLVGEIRRWSDDPDGLPKTHDELIASLPHWLAKARAKASHDGVRFLVLLDALNQLEDHDHARLLGWLPSHPFTGPLRLVVSTLPGDTLEAVRRRGWSTLEVRTLASDERPRVIDAYLRRFCKTLEPIRRARLASASAAANPLYLRILLDELRVTGTRDLLDERLTSYLAATDIPSLLRLILARYERDYERDRKGLVGDTLGLIWAARRGLTEAELLRLLRPAALPQMPVATWAPLRAALEESLVDRGGVLGFAHDFLRAAVKDAYVSDDATRDRLRLRLADDFEAQPVTPRSCDELPWLLRETGQRDRLRACLLHVDRFLEIHARDELELQGDWVFLGGERTMGPAYLASFQAWSSVPGRADAGAGVAANQLGLFLSDAGLPAQAEPLLRLALEIARQCNGPDHPDAAIPLGNLAALLVTAGRFAEAEPLLKQALELDEHLHGKDASRLAAHLNNLAQMLQAATRFSEAEALLRRALRVAERAFGGEHPIVARLLSNLAGFLDTTGRHAEAEPLIRRALTIDERCFGAGHPMVAVRLSNLAALLVALHRFEEAEPLMRQALEIDERSYGPDHPNVAVRLGNLAHLLQATHRAETAEPLMRRALKIDERSSGEHHPDVAVRLSNLANLLQGAGRLDEAEPLMRRALAIDERAHGPDHPEVAIRLNNLANLLQTTGRLDGAEPLMRRALAIDERAFGRDHATVALRLGNLAMLLHATKRLAEAEPLLRRALAIHERLHGELHPSTAVHLNNLAEVLRAGRRPREAEAMMRRALAIDERICGNDHPSVAHRLNNLAQLLLATDRVAEAELMMRRALAIDERCHGQDHPRVAADLNNLAMLLHVTHRLTEAAPLMRRTLESLLESTRATGHAHPHLEAALGNYAALLAEMGQRPERVSARLNALGAAYGIRFGRS